MAEYGEKYILKKIICGPLKTVTFNDEHSEERTSRAQKHVHRNLMKSCFVPILIITTFIIMNNDIMREVLFISQCNHMFSQSLFRFNAFIRLVEKYKSFQLIL